MPGSPHIIRLVVAGLLVGSAVLFIFATGAERHRENSEHRAGAPVEHVESPAPTTTAPTPTSVQTAPVTATAPTPTTSHRGDSDRGEEHSAPGVNPATTTPSPTASSDRGLDEQVPAPSRSTPAAVVGETGGEHSDADQHRGEANVEKAETLFGVRTESTSTTAAAVALSVLAAAIVLWARRRWLWPVVAFAAALALLDGREAAHQAGLGHGGLEVLAVVLAVIHLAAGVAIIFAVSGRWLEPAAGR